MPCDGSHLEAQFHEIESRKVAQHFIYLASCGVGDVPSPEIRAAARDYYGNSAKLDKWTAALCATLKGMSAEDMNHYVYDGRSAKARKLADWWQEHEKADAAKAKQAAAVKKLHKARNEALAKLTPADRKALGV